MSLLNVCVFVLGVFGMVGVVMFGWLRECDFQVGQGGVFCGVTRPNYHCGMHVLGLVVGKGVRKAGGGANVRS